MPAIVDLIYVEYRDGRTMSCAIIDGDNSKLLGPVPGKESVKTLASMLVKELPEQFPTEKAAQDHLTFVHFRNITTNTNSAGQDYPFRIEASTPTGEKG